MWKLEEHHFNDVSVSITQSILLYAESVREIIGHILTMCITE